jgi:predicted AAA+ superfamily ATPase
MQNLIEISEKQIARTQVDSVRSMMDTVNWNARLIGIKGARGIGKTTLLLQYIKIHLKNDLDNTLYTSLDQVWYNSNSLIDLVRQFSQKGGKYLFLDEVHKYPNWAQELKNAYDQYPELKIVFTGSSLLEILNARTDLSRRAVVYSMQGLSFREYLKIEKGLEFPVLKLDGILKNHTAIARTILEDLKPLQYFEEYLKTGYYPFYQEEKDLYFMRLNEVLNLMLEIEMPLLRGVDVAYVAKLKQVLSIIAKAVPFSPNVSKLSEKIQINRNTLLTYFHYLDEVNLTKNLFKENTGINLLQKPMKIYLENTNLMYLLARDQVNEGNLRETFFANQVGYQHALHFISHTDFLVDDTYFFEIGGRNKTSKQLLGKPNSYVVKDDLEIGRDQIIPIWIFGFLY